MERGVLQKNIHRCIFAGQFGILISTYLEVVGGGWSFFSQGHWQLCLHLMSYGVVTMRNLPFTFENKRGK